MEQLKAIIIDDERNSLQNLQQKLAEFCPDITIAATAERPEEAIGIIRQHNPDVLFLDIEMPRMNGFRMLEELDDYNGEIIFTTAYDHYAVDAIRISAFDYLTKPVSIAELQHAVARLLKHRQQHTRERFEILKQSMQQSKSPEDRMAIPSGDGLDFVQIKMIIRIESSSNYSRIFFTGGRSMLVTRLLKDFEEMLMPYRFFRVHHSHLINLAHINKYIKGEGGHVIMSNGDQIDISRRKKEEFMKLVAGG